MSSTHLRDGTLVITDNPVRPLLDKRSYLLEQLGNGLRVQWVHSPEAEKSTLVMKVASGSVDDGDVLGIAHAVEHLLFRGSEKYPRRVELSERIEKYGGTNNAHTEVTETTFWFEINTATTDEEASSKLWGIADVLLQHFIRPSFELDTIEHELPAIEAEFQRHIRNDWNREEQLRFSLMNPDHPYSGVFVYGNRKSLGNPSELPSKAVEHWKTHYCAQLMHCVIISPLPMDDMQNMLRVTLNEIPNRGLRRPDWGTIPCYLDENMGTETFVKAVTDMDYLFMDFYFPGKQDAAYSARGEHAADIFSQKQDGSLYAVLRWKKLIYNIGVSTSYEHAGYRAFRIWVCLTKNGVENFQSVVQEIFYMIALMRAEGPQEKRVEEETRARHIRFCTRKMSDRELALKIANNMVNPFLQPENLIYGSNDISTESCFNASDIVEHLDQLQPKNMRLVLISPEFHDLVKDLAPRQNEEWYGTEWRTRKIPPRDIDRYTATAGLPRNELPPELKLPSSNQFITKYDFQSKLLRPRLGTQLPVPTPAGKREKRRPTPKALQTGNTEIWFAPGEGALAESRIKVTMCIHHDVNLNNTHKRMKTELFMVSAGWAVAALSDQIEQAGMDCRAIQSYYGPYFSVTGFKDVIHDVLTKFLSELRNHQPTEADFHRVKEAFLQRFEKARMNNPLSHSIRHLEWLVSEHDPSYEEKEAAVRAIEFGDLMDWEREIFNTGKFQVFVSGDATKDEARGLVHVCERTLQLRWQNNEPPRCRARRLSSGGITLFKRIMVDPENKNSFVAAVTIFSASRQAKDIAGPMLLVQILKDSVFHTLRTEKGLGYDAGISLQLKPQMCAVSVNVECPNHSCLEAAPCMIEFMNRAHGIMESLSAEDFEKYRDVCIRTSDYKMQTFDEHHTWMWNNIWARTYGFHKPERLVEELKKATQPQLVNLAKQLGPSSSKSTQIWLFMEAKQRETAEGNPAYVELFPKDRRVTFAYDRSDLPDLSAPEEPEEDPEDFKGDDGEFGLC